MDFIYSDRHVTYYGESKRPAGQKKTEVKPSAMNCAGDSFNFISELPRFYIFNT
jgi:hypothetical protein